MYRRSQKLWSYGVILATAILLHTVVKAIDMNHDGMDDDAVLPHAQQVSGNFAGPVSLSVHINQDNCLTGSVQCRDFGFGAPADDNQIPVSVVIQVQDRDLGTPVTGLGSTAFAVDTGFVPAGGSNLERVDCPNCFQESGGGIYQIFLKPIRDITWKSGSYTIQIQVRTGGQVGRALARIDIPF